MSAVDLVALPQVRALWPSPADVTVTRGPSARDHAQYLVYPSPARPRLLVPVGVPGAQRMFARHGGGLTGRAVRQVWRLAHGTGVAAFVPMHRLSVRPDPEGIEACLGHVVGDEVRIGVLLGPPRANLKPVVQIFDATGETIAFAKLGVNPLTERLVSREADALRLIGKRQPVSFTAPELLHDGSWRSAAINVQRALPLAQSSLAPVEPPFAVMTEIAELDGEWVEDLGGSAYLSSLAGPEDDLWNGINVTDLRRLRAAVATHGACPMGSWHGDFGPWNMATDGTVVNVWDWERFDSRVPYGLDAAHYRTQLEVARGEPAGAWRRVVADVSRLLQVGGRPTDAAPVIAAAYLLTITDRYLRDVAGEPTAAMRRRMSWVAGAAGAALNSLEARSR